MLRSLLLGACLAASLAACITGPKTRAHTAVNTALTGACLAASLPPCTIAPGAEKAAARTQEAAADTKKAATAAAVRSSCLTETGPRLPLRPGQCSAYGRSYSSEELQGTGQTGAGEALRMLDPRITTNR